MLPSALSLGPSARSRWPRELVRGSVELLRCSPGWWLSCSGVFWQGGFATPRGYSGYGGRTIWSEGEFRRRFAPRHTSLSCCSEPSRARFPAPSSMAQLLALLLPVPLSAESWQCWFSVSEPSRRSLLFPLFRAAFF